MTSYEGEGVCVCVCVCVRVSIKYEDEKGGVPLRRGGLVLRGFRPTGFPGGRVNVIEGPGAIIKFFSIHFLCGHSHHLERTSAPGAEASGDKGPNRWVVKVLFN